MIAVAATARRNRAPTTLDQQIADWLQSVSYTHLTLPTSDLV